MPSKWIEHIKSFAKSNGMTYKDALKDPKCKEAYHTGKGLGGEVKPNIELKIEEKGRRGRPPKYFTDEDRKKAKSAKTMESNKRKKAQKSKKEESSSDSDSDMEGGVLIGKPISNAIVKPISKPIGMPNPLKETKKVMKELEGKGIIAGYKTENANGLGHIYPISHELVLQMLSCCSK